MFGDVRFQLDELTDNTPEVQAALTELSNENIYVGIPEQKAPRPGDPYNNAQLSHIHEKGDPATNLPPRAFLVPAIDDQIEYVGLKMKDVLISALNGDVLTATDKMELLAGQLSNFVKKWFTNPKNGWAPNAPYTIRMKGSDKPLIDTGALRSAVTGVVGE